MLSRIATICDVYDAATTIRVYSRAKLPVEALFEMRTYCCDFFDPVIEQGFPKFFPVLRCLYRRVPFDQCALLPVICIAEPEMVDAYLCRNLLFFQGDFVGEKFHFRPGRQVKDMQAGSGLFSKCNGL